MPGAILTFGSGSARQRGPVAAFLSTAGWASAARRVLGEAWIATPAGILDPADARRIGSAPHLTSAAAPRWPRYVPVTAKTAARDVLHRRRARRSRIDPDGPWRGREVRFVWQRHELFQRAGIDLARSLGVPSVLFVTAPQVWEARQWGVRRPGWERFWERRGDVPALRAADLVACGTEVVAEQVRRLGVAPERVLITPTGVDLDLFDPRPDAAELRSELGLDDSFVIGWMGSFRRFHAIEHAVEAAAAVDGSTLLLVGDGPERPAVERLAAGRGVRAVCTGTVPHTELARYLGVMDAAVVTSSPERSFHYSPLKLAEYLAAGSCVVAPRIGQLAERLHDGVDAVLYPAGDPAALAAVLRSLRDDPVRRKELGAAAREAAERSWSWDRQIERIVAALG